MNKKISSVNVRSYFEDISQSLNVCAINEELAHDLFTHKISPQARWQFKYFNRRKLIVKHQNRQITNSYKSHKLCALLTPVI